MISRNIVTDILFIIILVILQIFLLNRLVIFGKYPPILFPIYIMFYPFNRSKFQFLGTSFLLGIGIDMFLGTWGINAFVATFLAFIRTIIFRTSTETQSDFFSFQSMRWTQFLVFILLNLFVYQLMVQFIEYFKIDRVLEVLLDVVISSLYSFIIVLLYVIIFKIKNKI